MRTTTTTTTTTSVCDVVTTRDPRDEENSTYYWRTVFCKHDLWGRALFPASGLWVVGERLFFFLPRKQKLDAGSLLLSHKRNLHLWERCSPPQSDVTNVGIRCGSALPHTARFPFAGSIFFPASHKLELRRKIFYPQLEKIDMQGILSNPQVTC